MLRASSAFSIAVALAVLAPQRAAAQEDFASCPASLPACDATTDNCCYRPFDPVATDKAIVIPMDRCHQVLATSGKLQSPPASAPAWCLEPGGSSADEGIFQAYGLVYRLMQAGIPVYWVVNPTKDPPALTNSQNYASQTYTERDIDFWIVEAGKSPPTTSSPTMNACPGASCLAPPVARLNPATLATADPYNWSAFPVRGSAFVIAPEDRARFNQFWLKIGEFSGNAGKAKYDFSAVDLYELQLGAEIVYQDFTTAGPAYSVVRGAPVSVTIDYAPPRLARLAPAGVSEIWLKMAKLHDPAAYPACLTTGFSPADAVFCDVKESDIQAGRLVDGEFVWAWIDNWKDNSPCGNLAEVTAVEKVHEFMRAVPGVRPGGHVMFMEAVIGVFEGCSNLEPVGKKGLGIAPNNTTPKDPFILRYPSNLFMQWGDIPMEFANGSLGYWHAFGGSTESGAPAAGYEPAFLPSNGGSLIRLVSMDNASNGICTRHKSDPSCDTYGASGDVEDVGVYFRFENDPRNGIGFYMGGNQVNNAPSHLRMILNALIALPAATVPQTPPDIIEVSRNSPIVVGFGPEAVQYQGTYEVYDPPPEVTTYTGSASDDTFEFPYTKGHFRAIDADTLAQTETDFENLSSVFDAADGIPTPNPAGCSTWFGSGCRTVFTSLTTGEKPDRVFFTTGNAEQLQPYLGASLSKTEAETLISRVLAGRKDGTNWVPALGGVDRSTVAVIEASPFVGTERPQMAYFGALDGMLHAVCTEALGPCAYAGQELWAYIPRTQLPVLRSNTQRVDGSPKVADVFGDFDGDGVREWRTVLTMQTGHGEPGYPERAPVVFAMDITDPGNPQILWEVATPASRGVIEQGVGLGLAMGPVYSAGNTLNLTFAISNNGGLGTAGAHVMALDTVTGEQIWEWSHVYPTPATRAEADDKVRAANADIPPVPSTGIPAGIAAYGEEHGTALKRLAVTTLYGDLWILDAADGTNVYGNVPLFRFSSDFHPIGAAPTIYLDQSNGRFHAIVVSGGYADPIATTWAPDSYHQYAVSLALDAPVSVATMVETGGDYGGNRAFVIDLGAGQRAFAQAVVAGNELFIVTDSTNVNTATYGLGGSTGTLSRYSLSGGGQVGSSITVAGGAAAVDASPVTGVVHVGTGKAAQKITMANFDTNTRGGTELSFEASSQRQLWLRMQ